MSAAAAPVAATPVVKKVKKVKLASHPPANVMVVEAVSKLNEKKGSSLAAIKKFIGGFYTVDVEKLAPFIRKALKKQVEAGKLTQTKGSGASGSFKLAVKKTAAAGEKKAKSPKKNTKNPKKTASPKKKKVAGSPKTKAPKKPAAPKKVKVAKTPKSPKKTKPAAKKAATPKKPKTMKVKAQAKPKVASKKAAPKKK
ncbi:histone H1A, sperm [Folsomia candida]|uniref:Histone H1.2 n=1 Tax=Folsomia candida TaxID=158441 RepID=A0A226E570_FOLCA|nr:histone H1A, sperm [Folsomia candida]OXA52107.1 Histone H1.2 [Folsomia candida]